MPYWSEYENAQFFKLLNAYGKDFQQIAECMNKSYTQVRSHFYNIQVKQSKTLKEEPQEYRSLQKNQHLKFHFIVFDYVK
ncbi:SANT/Myb_domain [Hexamita inflata]|uniref:SANT/Myb domain n=1 Tax=Hexamita inflata TaxID=28002 RepID=A0AA86RH16_9EUKA|nr:SANT/Myb domain [Hexamita inflata]